MPLKNIILRNLSDDDRKAIEAAKRETGEVTASKALLAVCKSHMRLTQQIHKMHEEVSRLRIKNEQLEDTFQKLAHELDKYHS